MNTRQIDWQDQTSIWAAHPSNHRLMPGGSEYESRYLWVRGLIEPGSRVLDIGCNCGQLAVNLVEDLGCRIVGVDIVEDFIEHCRQEKGQFGEFYCADFSRDREVLDDLDLWGNFDVVTAMEVIEHPVDLRGFRDHCCRALRPGGKLILTTPHPDSPEYGYKYLRAHAHHTRMLSPWRLEQLFGPMAIYHEIRLDGELNQIGAVFVK